MSVTSNVSSVLSTQVPFTFVNVLILDDNLFDRMRIRRFLSLMGFDHVITEAKSLSEFTDCVNGRQFDVVFLDFDLPDGTGFEAVKIHQDTSPSYQSASIMIASHDSQKIGKKARELGCTEYISKQDLSMDTFTPAFLSAIGVSEV